MKKAISLVLATIFVLSYFGLAGVEYSPSGLTAQAMDIVTESGVQVTIESILYKSNAHTMQFPNADHYATKETSTPGDYVISRDINNLGYRFVFPAGTTELSGTISLDGETNWRGVRINATNAPEFWPKDENGNVDFTKPVTFNRPEDLAEQDEYGLIYREYLYEKGVGGFKDYNRIYWKLEYVCDGETYTDYFDIPLVDYAEPDRVTVKALNFNVAGLPSVGTIIGMPNANVPANQKEAAKFIVENDYDIVAVQEDFGYHKHLVGGLDGYNYMTNHTGTIPGGDGVNVFTKSMPIYNETRVAWTDACGIILNGADELTPKGFVYSVIDIGNGIYVDFYDLHADAYGDEGSIQAREKQYKQLADFICARMEENDRPVIITGDFNAFMHRHVDNGNMYEYFYEQCGLKDAWVEVHNGGDYNNFYQWHISGMEAWGNWDSVERFMYKSGGGVGVIATDFNFIEVTNENGNVISDHSAAECEFTFIKTDGFVENTQQLEVTEKTGSNFINNIKWIFKDLAVILSNLDELFLAISELT